MVTKSKLKLALAADKGIDLRKIKEERRVKAKHRETAKKITEKQAKLVDEDDEEEEEEDDDDDVISIEGGVTVNAEFEDVDSDEEDDDDEEDNEDDGRFDIEALDDTDTDSDSEVEMEEKIERPSKKTKTSTKIPTEVEEKDDESSDEEDPEEDDVPLSDIDGDAEDLEDIVPHTKLTINNKAALFASLNRIRIDTSSSAPFASHQSLSSSKLTADEVPDVQDDLQRELALLSQSLEAARKGRALLLKEGVPFSRPNDYFAEMAKDDGQMEKIKAKLIDEASAKKAAAEARKLRDLKKFGKQVQVAKLQERQKTKKETLDKIKTLKRKRQENSSNLDTHEADLFDVGVDNEIKSYTNAGGRGGRDGKSGSGVNAKRAKKNEKYGFGGKKRHTKSGDAISSGDLSAFNPKRMKGGVAKGRVGKPAQQRPGKNRRKSMSNK
ncbi:rRNA-processing protein EBP2 [Colletotrichum chlorophyti]|uniref:rRNA-processing protein EBP2 n=1 Tax=Colletotrichum chlorophyti TaxID=708187 RepID=A0A1Q8S1X4_9PEZI|nr:rRNA-processing protein EBP2 [Colletotrichum chlorophyti]